MHLLTVGKLISTTDIATARYLGQVVNVENILHGARPGWFRQSAGVLQFMYHGEFYELAEA